MTNKEISLFTNKLHVGISSNKLREIFRVLRISLLNKDSEWKVNEEKKIDMMAIEGVASCVYEYGGAIWLAFYRDNNYFPDIESLRIKYPDFGFEEFDFSSEAAEISDPENIIWEYKRIVMKLLINSMGASFGCNYSNVFGKFILVEPSWKEKKVDPDGNLINIIWGVDVDLNESGNLNLKVVTFVDDIRHAAKSTNYKRFKLSDGNHIVPARTGEKRPYYLGTVGEDKHTVDFFDQRKIDDTLKWRIYRDIMDKLNYLFCGMFIDSMRNPVKLTFVKQKMNYLKAAPQKDLESYIELVRREKIISVVSDKDDDARQLKNNVIDVLNSLGYNVRSEIEGGDYVINIIHQPKYYNKDKNTSHIDSHIYDFGRACNCMTVEQFKSSKDNSTSSLLLDGTKECEGPALKNIISELVLKEQISDERHRFSDNMDYSIEIITARRAKEKDNKFKQLEFYCLRFNEDGSLKYKIYKQTDSDTKKVNMLNKIFNGNLERNEYMIRFINVDGTNQNLVIRNDEEATLPDLTKIYELNEKLTKKTEVSALLDVLVNSPKDFVSEDLHEMLVTSLMKYEAGTEICFKNFLGSRLREYNEQLINKKDKLRVKTVNAKYQQLFEYAALPQTLVSTFKSSSEEGCKLSEAFSGIKYYYDEVYIDGILVNCVKYSVGSITSPNMRLARRTLVRTLYTVDETGYSTSEILNEELIKRYLSFLVVDFVRSGLYTVVPFHCKFLREYMNQEEKKKEARPYM